MRTPVLNTSSLASKTGVQNSTYVYGADAGSTDSYVVALSPVITSYTAGMEIAFYANTANTGAASLDAGGGAKTIKKSNDQDLATGDIEAGQIVTVRYNGTDDVFEMVSQTAASAGETATSFGALVNAAGAATPNDTDLVATAENAGLLKKITWTNVKAFLKTYFDTLYPAETTSTLGSTINGSSAATPNDTDLVTTVESSVVKKITWTNVKAFLKTYFDTLYLALAGGTLTGNIILGENTSIDFDPAGSADGKYTGMCITGTAGAALAFGDLVYLDPTDSRWELVDANAAAGADGDARGMIGICVLAAGADGNATKILLKGTIRADAAFPALTIGAPAYASETAGDIVVSQPVTTDAVIRVVGFALTADELYFNPSSDYITHT